MTDYSDCSKFPQTIGDRPFTPPDVTLVAGVNWHSRGFMTVDNDTQFVNHVRNIITETERGGSIIFAARRYAIATPMARPG